MLKYNIFKKKDLFTQQSYYKPLGKDWLSNLQIYNQSWHKVNEIKQKVPNKILFSLYPKTIQYVKNTVKIFQKLKSKKKIY